MRLAGYTAALALVMIVAPCPTVAKETSPEKDDGQATQASTKNDAEEEQAENTVHWRDDPTVKRHTGSYIGGAVGYMQSRAWLPETEDHDKLSFGPLHTWQAAFRVGDAFAEWFALGFQIDITNTVGGPPTLGAFNLMLDATFYPWEGLGIRPSLGLGLGFAQGKESWEFGGGGPGCFSLALTYEFRVLPLFVIAPVVQVYGIVGEDFDGLFLFFGIELLKWFATATG
ncbi:MAG: hypothetical protein JRI55_04110 [Deltaproteobacteria bacterium]|jgi:hypothetical protein|nr:hypothetical protein [Deltaproteobacteria bacterium]